MHIRSGLRRTIKERTSNHVPHTRPATEGKFMLADERIRAAHSSPTRALFPRSERGCIAGVQQLKAFGDLAAVLSSARVAIPASMRLTGVEIQPWPKLINQRLCHDSCRRRSCADGVKALCGHGLGRLLSASSTSGIDLQRRLCDGDPDSMLSQRLATIAARCYRHSCEVDN
jgi:hypothetical protein